MDRVARRRVSVRVTLGTMNHRGTTESLYPILADVLDRAIKEIRRRRTRLYTVAFYRDRESSAVSACADTKTNSRRTVLSENRFSMNFFADAAESGDLDQAVLFQANIGRSLSLGDFTLVNLGRTTLETNVSEVELSLAMMRSLIARQTDLLALAPNADELVFVCSGVGAEIGYVWSRLRSTRAARVGASRTGASELRSSGDA